jgi:hypothetical protein
VIAALAATVALAAPSREALIERWLHADRAHARAQLESPPHHSAPAVNLRALAQGELASPGRYQLTELPPPPVRDPWWMPAWHWLADRWNQFWNAVFARVHVGPSGMRGIGEALLAAIGLLLLYVAIRLVTGIYARRPAPAAAEPLAARPDSAALYRQACDGANRGDYGSAALLLFAAMVALLDVRGTIAGERSATVGDLRRELRAGDAALVPAFDAIAAPFVEKAYAERAVGAPQWQRARDAYEQLNQ